VCFVIFLLGISGSSDAKKDVSFLCVFFISFNNHYVILNNNKNSISTEFILVSIPFKVAAIYICAHD